MDSIIMRDVQIPPRRFLSIHSKRSENEERYLKRIRNILQDCFIDVFDMDKDEEGEYLDKYIPENIEDLRTENFFDIYRAYTLIKKFSAEDIRKRFPINQSTRWVVIYDEVHREKCGILIRDNPNITQRNDVEKLTNIMKSYLSKKKIKHEVCNGL